MEKKCNEAREILNSKLGIPIDYQCEGYEGEHGIYDSKEIEYEMVKFLEGVEIKPSQWRGICAMYQDDLIQVIDRNPNLRIYGLINSNTANDSHIDADKLKSEFANFLNGQSILNPNSKIMMIEYLRLLSVYSVSELEANSDQVRKELKSGVFDYVSVADSRLTEENRTKLRDIADEWNKDDISRYLNLPLLKSRYSYLLESGKCQEEHLQSIKKNIAFIDFMEQMGIPQKGQTYRISEEQEVCMTEFFSKMMEEMYSSFEKFNREDILRSIYHQKRDVSISTYEDIPENLLLHFYNPYTQSMLKTVFENVIINRQRKVEGLPPVELQFQPHSKPANDPALVEEYKEQIASYNLEVVTDELRPNEAFHIYSDDQGSPRLDALQDSQLATTVISKKRILDLIASRDPLACGKFAMGIGFDETSMRPENILLSCTKNADSNLGFENIPCSDAFVELSCTFQEIQSSQSERKEILLSRNNLHPSYLFCIYDGNSIEKGSRDEKIIHEELGRARKLGISTVSLDISEISLDKLHTSQPITHNKKEDELEIL